MTEAENTLENEGFRRGVAMDIAFWAERNRSEPGIRFFLRHLLFRPGFYFVFWHRVVRLLRRLPFIGSLLARPLVSLLELIYSSEIGVSVRIGGGLYVPHPFGIVVGDRCRIGRRVTILQNVTLGNRSLTSPEQPILLDEAYIGAGAVLLGGITIGKGAMVGANAVVLEDVPAARVAVGNPARLAPPRQ